MMDTRSLKNDHVEIDYLTSSLRITGLSPAGKPNMLADLSALPPIATPFGDFYFRGGHRLWHAPEAMPRTYIPDAGEITITDLPLGVRLQAQTEPGTGIRKQIEIHLAAGAPSVVLTHTMINDGLWPVELAPWAITQFRLGGVAIFPLPVENADPAGLLPNRQFSFWPYTRIGDPRLKWFDRFVLFYGDALLPPFKMGYLNPHGWMAYWLDGVLFRKSLEVQLGLPHPDGNCNTEVYCGNRFIELESLAPLTVLNPGESVNHVETWEILDGLDSLPGDMRAALASSS